MSGRHGDFNRFGLGRFSFVDEVDIPAANRQQDADLFLIIQRETVAAADFYNTIGFIRIQIANHGHFTGFTRAEADFDVFSDFFIHIIDTIDIEVEAGAFALIQIQVDGFMDGQLDQRVVGKGDTGVFTDSVAIRGQQSGCIRQGTTAVARLIQVDGFDELNVTITALLAGRPAHRTVGRVAQ